MATQRQRKKDDGAHDAVKVRGFARMMLRNAKTGAIEYDSGFVKNAFTANGFQHYIVGVLGAVANSSRPLYMQLATQTNAVNSTQTSASGQFDARKSAAFSFVANGTLQGTASWNTNEATQSNLGALGYYATDTGGSIANVALLTATTSKNTNQTLSATLQWRFS